MTPSANWHYCFFKINLGSCVQRLSLSPSYPSPSSFALFSVLNMQISHFCPWGYILWWTFEICKCLQKIAKEKSKCFRLATRSFFLFSIQRNRWFSLVFSGVFVWFASSVKKQKNLNERQISWVNATREIVSAKSILPFKKKVLFT